MNRIFTTFIFSLLMFLSASVQAQNFEDAGDYMDHIGKQQVNVSKKFLAYNSARAHSKKDKKVAALREKLLSEVQDAQGNINSMPSFNGDKEYRDSAMAFMKLYYHVLNDDYSKIVNMQEIAEQSYDLMEAYLLAEEMVSKKLQDANEALKLAQRKFADKNKINLVSDKSDIGEMMKKVGEVNKYYNPVYLIFFKSYKQEMYLNEAVEKKNITAIEQNKNTLLQYAQAGLKELEAIKPFNGDNSLVLSCRRVLEFYIKEANEIITPITDYILLNEQFTKMKSDFEKKSEHSKEEVENYNKYVKDINAAVNKSNNATNTLNQRRTELISGWNEAADAFTDTHMPVYN